MPRFAVAGNKGAASVRTIVSLRADATVPTRGRIYDYMVGNISTPADNAFDHQLYRVTTAGTASAAAPAALDPADAAAINDGLQTFTVDPTISTVLMRVPLNQRATYRWVAAPGGELVFPATADNGIAGGVAAATTSDFSATLMADTQ